MKFVQKEFDNKFHQFSNPWNSFEASFFLFTYRKRGLTLFTVAQKNLPGLLSNACSKVPPFLDLSDEYANINTSTLPFIKLTHLSRFGNCLVAERISAYLWEQLVPSIHRDPESGYPKTWGISEHTVVPMRRSMQVPLWILISNIGIRGVKTLKPPRNPIGLPPWRFLHLRTRSQWEHLPASTRKSPRRLRVSISIPERRLRVT